MLHKNSQSPNIYILNNLSHHFIDANFDTWIIIIKNIKNHRIVQLVRMIDIANLVGHFEWPTTVVSANFKVYFISRDECVVNE